MFRAIGLRWQLWWRSKLFFASLLSFTILLSGFAQNQLPQTVLAQETIAQPQEQLPEPNVHPLPPTLAQWQDSQQQGDYFSAIEPTPVGYLIWSVFPVQVYIEPVNLAANAFELERSRSWVEAVTQAVQEWNTYLPLELIDSSETADIAIWRSAPPIQLNDRSDAESSNTGSTDEADNFALPRIRSAETKYHLFVDRPADAPAQLSQRFTIQLTPNQTPDYIKATARHEIGHALGIWGHSSVETDALYFSQVRNSPPISHRDINTLKRVYQQPTRIGWDMSHSASRLDQNVESRAPHGSQHI